LAGGASDGAGSSSNVEVARASTGVAGVAGVSGGVFLRSFRRRASLFFSSVLKKTLIVVRNDLLGLQSSAATGVCSQTGHDEGNVDWPYQSAHITGTMG